MVRVHARPFAILLSIEIWACSSVWLERVPDKDEVHGSSPCTPIFSFLAEKFLWGGKGPVKTNFRSIGLFSFN